MTGKLFQSKYPIMLAAMNKVSDLSLAVAASKAGIFPSISGFNYYTGRSLQIDLIKKDLKKFNDATGTNNLILSIELKDIFKDPFMEEVCTLNAFSHVEVVDESKIISQSQDDNDLEKLDNISQRLNQLRALGVTPMFKILTPGHWVEKNESVRNMFSGSILKSSDASGSVIADNRHLLTKEFQFLKKFSPDKVFVPTGGISTSQQVKEFVDLGAEIVGVGAYFVTAEECSVAVEVKQKIIDSTSSDIKKFNDTGHNALIFSKFLEDDMNHTRSLMAGTTNSNSGHIYMGRSIDDIKQIKPIKDLVQELVSDLI
jgi:NAD(P)H-dependent flavin oxidoreductase YrpB (nitropropane dioxygenase family)